MAAGLRRPYKEAFELGKAYEIISESRGGHFDPEIVDAFFAVKDAIESIKARYKDQDLDYRRQR